jgi:nucleoside-diphosphate-sugar epimerase
MEISRQKVFATGGAVFIGSHVVDRLVDVADHTVVFDNLNTGSMGNMAHMMYARFHYLPGYLPQRRPQRQISPPTQERKPRLD